MKDQLSISVKDLGIQRGLLRMKKTLRSRAIANALITAMEGTVLKEARANLRKNNSIFQGHLRMSLRAEVRKAASFNTQVRAGSLGVDYGKNIEEGTPPGTSLAPGEVDKIIEWCKRKLHLKKYGTTFVLWVAGNVIESIKKKGTKAKPFLMPAWRDKHTAFEAMFAQKLRVQLKLNL